MTTALEGAPAGAEARLDRVARRQQHDLDERDTELGCERVQAIAERGPPEVLRDDHVVSPRKVTGDQVEGEVARHLLRPLVGGPPAELGAERIDLDDERSRMLVRVAPCERRLADSGRSVDQEQHGADYCSLMIAA
jgi:hypothetical protein